MAYTALYRKWRPKSFPEVVGQEPVVRTLTNQIKAGRVGHAYLFCGTRGTGKTTVAKIFARAVNCEHPIEGSPCNECATCKAILKNSSMNVVEIDAASNNGVDNIREIREEVKYTPTQGRFRVYIIDEVHMLSPGAYNALLKTLEEPPSYVIFILATTEVHKIPVTVLSRCQRYDFKRISAEEIFGQLKKLTDAEGVSAEEKALRYISRAADGAMRDALSILEECISYYYGQPLTYENVLDVVGAVDNSQFISLLECIKSADVKPAMKIIEQLVYSGRDIAQAVGDFVWLLRNLLMIQTSEVGEDELGMSAESFSAHKSIAMQLSMEQLMGYIRNFSDLQNSMRYAADKRTLLEMAVIRAMNPRTEKDFSGLLGRLRALEERVLSLAEGGVKFPEKTPKDISKTEEKDTAKPVKEEEIPQAAFEDLEQLKKRWKEIANACGGMMEGFLERTSPTYRNEHGFIVQFEKVFFLNQINTPERRKTLEDAAVGVMGKEFHFSLMLAEQLDENIRLVKKQDEPSHQGIGIKMGEE